MAPQQQKNDIKSFLDEDDKEDDVLGRGSAGTKVTAQSGSSLDLTVDIRNKGQTAFKGRSPSQILALGMGTGSDTDADASSASDGASVQSGFGDADANDDDDDDDDDSDISEAEDFFGKSDEGDPSCRGSLRGSVSSLHGGGKRRTSIFTKKASDEAITMIAPNDIKEDDDLHYVWKKFMTIQALRFHTFQVGSCPTR